MIEPDPVRPNRFSAGRRALPPVMVAVTDPAVARRARRLVAREVAAARTALARELPRVTLAAGQPVHLSPVLADLVRASLDAAQRTDGAVDPTIGAALLHARPTVWLPTCGSTIGALNRPRYDWRDVHLDGHRLTVPRQVLLDLNATAPARTADRCARLVADRYNVSVLVALAGDVATAGPAPTAGWRVPTGVLPAGRALGTSRAAPVEPRTGRPAERTHPAVVIEAADCLTASALATALALRADTTLPPGTTVQTGS